MDNNGWKDISTCPIYDCASQARRIIVWHIFQGVMAYNAFYARENRFCVYWREPPENWINPREALPMEKEADSQSCIIAIDKHGDIRVRDWRQVQATGDIKGWVPCPPPPDNYKELRKNAG